MKKLAFILLIFPLFVFAQKSHFYVNGVTAGLGTSYTNLKKLNQSLLDAKLTEIKPNFANIGLSLFHLNRRIFYGIDGYALARATRVDGTGPLTYAYMRQAVLMPKIGAVVYQFDEVYFVYPSVGFGGGGSFLRYRDPSDGKLYKDNIWGTAIEGALNFNIVTPIPGDRDNNACLTLTGGYLYTPKWGKTWNTSLVNNETNFVSPQGFFFRVNFGMASGNRD